VGKGNGEEIGGRKKAERLNVGAGPAGIKGKRAWCEHADLRIGINYHQTSLGQLKGLEARVPKLIGGGEYGKARS